MHLLQFKVSTPCCSRSRVLELIVYPKQILWLATAFNCDQHVSAIQSAFLLSPFHSPTSRRLLPIGGQSLHFHLVTGCWQPRLYLSSFK